MTETIGRITALWRYPVKSMLGETLETAEVTEQGVFGDRSYALVDEETGKVASAKSPRKFGRLFEFRATLEEAADGNAVPPARITFPDGTVLDSGHEQLNRSLSDEFGREVTLRGVSATAGTVSTYEYDQSDTDAGEGQGPVTDMNMPASTFFDASPILILGTATLRELEGLHPEGSFAIRRFRPNLVLDLEDGEGFAEERWIDRTLLVGDEVRLRVTEPCPRCVMVNLPQEDLPKDTDILRTVTGRNEGNAGVYATVLQGGRVNPGDRVVVD